MQAFHMIKSTCRALSDASTYAGALELRQSDQSVLQFMIYVCHVHTSKRVRNLKQYTKIIRAMMVTFVNLRMLCPRHLRCKLPK